MAENKPTNRERLREITDGIEQGIKELFESEKYMRYLSVMSRFHRYSVNNTMLIYMQKPDATLVAGYNKWKDQFERHVKKGEHGITIIAPTPYKKKIEEQKLDPDTKAPILDKDGKIVTEEKEIEIPMFRPVKVFDVSQTDGKPLPELASSLSGNVPNYEAFMEALRRSAPVPITFEAMAADTDGYFSADHQKIAIRQGMSEVQTVSATVHEIAHSKLHNQKKIQIANDEQYQEIELFDKPGLFSNGRIVRDNLPEGVYCYDLRGSDYDPGEPVCVEEQVVVNHAGSVLLTEPLELAEDGRLMLTEEEGLNFVGGFSTLTQFLQEQRKDRHTEEVEAESISYAVCKYFGIETGENSFGYIASWSQGKELKELRASLETINKTSGTLISDIERHYKEICKERGIDPHAKAEPETAPIEQPEDATIFLLCQLIVDVLKLNGLGVITVSDTADAIREHSLKGNGLLCSLRNTVVLLCPFHNSFNFSLLLPIQICRHFDVSCLWLLFEKQFVQPPFPVCTDASKRHNSCPSDKGEPWDERIWSE